MDFIEISFKDNSTLRVEKLRDSIFDYGFTYRKKGLFKSLGINNYQNEDRDMCLSEDCVYLEYIDEYNDMYTLKEVLDVFNLFDKSSDYFTDISTLKEYSKESLMIDIDDIPTLEIENIENIEW